MSNWEKGSTRAWRRTRARVLARDGHVCRVQLVGCTTVATCVHHVVGRGVSGDDERYLIASCDNCNSKAGDPTKDDPPPRPVSSW